jgi:hypothetical protein
MRPSILIGLLACAGVSACSKERAPDRAAADSTPTARPVGAAPVDTTTPKTLSGTRWRLVEVQSMDDAQGTTRPDDPAKYTVAFDAESDRIYMRLDCNQVRGPYSAKRNADPKSGSLTIGPLVGFGTTCTPSALGARISRDMPYVRSYVFANGRLSMSLMADGGIYVWSREPNRY